MLNPNLNGVILSRVLNNLREGKMRDCLSLGFTEQELKELAQLNIDEIYDIANSHSPLFKTEINHDVLFRLIELARDNSQSRRTIDRALMLGASIQMLNQYFGMTTSEVSARRSLLGIDEPMGRKRGADDQQQELVWRKWQEHKQSVESLDTLEGLEVLIWIAEETGINLTEVWRLVSGWA